MLRRIFKRLFKEAVNICKSEYQLFKLRRELKGQAARLTR